MKIYIPFLAVAVVLSGCASTNYLEENATKIDSIYAPKIVEGVVPPADAVSGLVKMPNGAIRHYNYGGQPENCGHIYVYNVTNRMYVESLDGGFTWKEYQAPKGKEFGTFYYPPTNKYFNIIRKNGSTFFIDCDKDGNCIKEKQIAPWPLSVNEEAYIDGNRILMPVTLRTSSSEKHDFGFGALFLITDDFGETWSVSSTIKVPDHKAGGFHKGIRWNHNAMEPTIVKLNDGRLWTILRTSLDNLWQAHSKDGGKTWSKPTPLPFYATCVMPKIKRLSDGKLLLMWSNASPLPENEKANGIWEDVFTNRNVNHAAISEDDGKTWRGFREVLLDPRRNAPDFATTFGGDKSMHQSQAIEIAPNKILASIGQSKLHRKFVHFDIRWLYEKTRVCDFSNGLDDWSVFNYIKGIKGHCAYNRFAGCELVDSPEGKNKKCLELKYKLNDNLVDDIRGAVWNFPMGYKGEFSAKVKFEKGFAGAKLMLHDRWINPSDAIADKLGVFAFNLPSSLADGNVRDIKITFDTNAKATLYIDGKKFAEQKFQNKAPIGVSYVHFQSSRNPTDGGLKILSCASKVE